MEKKIINMRKILIRVKRNYLMYLDSINIYGWIMGQYLPYGGFKQIENRHHVKHVIENTPENSDIVYTLEVSLRQPKELHDYHFDLPLVSENRIPDNNSKQGKLLTTSYDKEKYVIHYRNLKQYLKMCLKLSIEYIEHNNSSNRIG